MRRCVILCVLAGWWLGGTFLQADETDGTIITGTTTIRQASDLSGTVTLDGGTLKTSTGGITLSNGFIINQAGGTVDVDLAGGGVLAISGMIADYAGATPGAYGKLIKTGSGTLKLSAVNTFLGTYQVNAGTLELATTRDIYTPIKMGSFVVNNGSLLRITAQNAFGASIGFPDMVTLNSSTLSTTTEAFANIGPITLNSGTILSDGLPTNNNVANYSFNAMITATGDSTISAARIAFRDGFGDGNSGKINVVGATDKLTISSELHFINSRTIEKLGAGTLVLSGQYTTHSAQQNFSLKVTEGTLQLGGGTATSTYDWSNCSQLTAISFENNTNAKTLAIAQAVDSQFTQAVAISSSGITLSNLVSGTTAEFSNVTGTSGVTLTKAGAGAVKLSSGTAFAGNLQVEAGTLQLTTVPANGTTLTLNGGALDLALSSAGTLSNTIVLNGGTISVTGSPLTIGSGSTITGDMVKTGTGELVLSNTQSTGTVTVNQGRLILDTSRGSGSQKWGNFTVNEGGELYFSVGNALGVLAAIQSLPDQVTVNKGTIINGFASHTNIPTLFLNDGRVTIATATDNGSSNLGNYCLAGPVIATGNSTIDANYVSVRGDVNTVTYGGETSGAFRVSGENSVLDLSSIIRKYGGGITALTKSGEGTLNFTGGLANGIGFNVDAGTLNLGMTKGTEKLSGVTVKSGAELGIIAADQEIAGTLAVASGGTLSFALDPDAMASLTATNLTFGDDAVLLFNLSDDFMEKVTSQTRFDFLTVTGSNGLTYEKFAEFVGQNATLATYFIPTLEGGSLSLLANAAALPEPTSGMLLLMGIAFMLRRRIRR
ncbi:MAG: autotransporter-associated beta strand repeat-containing protein [Planctomycetia bacterium]|nr:autotransporter-associated beta strand repeat-containing protein [Planctomycetia bacterium]